MECFIYASVAGGELLMMDNALLLPAESSCVFRPRSFSSHKDGLFSYVIISISMDRSCFGLPHHMFQTSVKWNVGQFGSAKPLISPVWWGVVRKTHFLILPSCINHNRMSVCLKCHESDANFDLCCRLRLHQRHRRPFMQHAQNELTAFTDFD